MKDVVMLAVVCLVPIALFGLAAWLMFNEVKGWGWFLAAALFLSGAIDLHIRPEPCAPPAPGAEGP